MYFVKTPKWLKWIYGSCTWDLPSREKVVYLTFDDGPDPEATVYVLNTLKHFDARASFFCVGKNVEAHPEIYARIINEGHQTQNHLNGWKTEDRKYFEDIEQASKLINSKLFRPPYGRIKRSQIKELKSPRKGYNIVMWDVLSGDFDQNLTADDCVKKVIQNVVPGSIVVFHDSKKAFPRLKTALPVVLEYFRNKGFSFRVIE
jgi:peptidoglycan/xylan/chitin deacetylase (PgdA/CDA1 family)